VRVLDPKLIHYTFTARAETVKATRFECVLVSKKANEYMLGVVNFNFQDRKAAEKAHKQFVADSVWTITKPIFDAKANIAFNGCPVKTVLDMAKPTACQRVPSTNQKELDYPMTYVDVELNLSKTIEKLSKMPMKSSGSAKHQGSSAAKPPSKNVDICGKLLDLTDKKLVEKGNRRLYAAEAMLADDSGGKVKVSIWDDAHALVAAVPVNDGVTLINCTATRAGDQVNINFWNCGHVLRGGSRAQSLAARNMLNVLETRRLTPPELSQCEDVMLNIASFLA
jgi:hypothetical protein